MTGRASHPTFLARRKLAQRRINQRRTMPVYSAETARRRGRSRFDNQRCGKFDVLCGEYLAGEVGFSRSSAHDDRRHGAQRNRRALQSAHPANRRPFDHDRHAEHTDRLRAAQPQR